MAETKKGIRVRESGSIRIAEEVIATIAYLASIRAPGVAEEVPKGDRIQDRTLKGSLLKGIRVVFLQEGMEINIQISVDRGTPAVLTAKSVQTLIRTDVENMTGMRVAAVNVTVSSIRI